MSGIPGSGPCLGCFIYEREEQVHGAKAHLLEQQRLLRLAQQRGATEILEAKARADAAVQRWLYDGKSTADC